MANIQERRNKEGKLISFCIRVFKGYDNDGKQLKPYTTTYPVPPGISEKTARKRAEAFAATFERDCKNGIIGDSRQRLDAYCDYYIALKSDHGRKQSTLERYKELTERIYKEIGHIKLCDLRAEHLNDFYTKLGKAGERKTCTNAIAKTDLAKILHDRGMTRVQIAKDHGKPVSAVEEAVKGKTVRIEVATAVASSLGVTLTDAFKVLPPAKTKLKDSTIYKYHRFLSAVLNLAVKEHLVVTNVAKAADAPYVEINEAKFLQKHEIVKVFAALEKEAIKWRIIITLFLLTGIRRGELVGLKWYDVDWESERLYIRRNVLYSSETGLYEVLPKTQGSIRNIKMEERGLEMLREYKQWQDTTKQQLGSYYQDEGYLFVQDNGRPIHPDSINNWLREFSERNSFPNLHPHMFRHTAASLLIFAGADIVSVSKRLGHKLVSTTTDVYGHVIAEANERNAEILANEIFSHKVAER